MTTGRPQPPSNKRMQCASTVLVRDSSSTHLPKGCQLVDVTAAYAAHRFSSVSFCLEQPHLGWLQPGAAIKFLAGSTFTAAADFCRPQDVCNACILTCNLQLRCEMQHWFAGRVCVETGGETSKEGGFTKERGRLCQIKSAALQTGQIADIDCQATAWVLGCWTLIFKCASMRYNSTAGWVGAQPGAVAWVAEMAAGIGRALSFALPVSMCAATTDGNRCQPGSGSTQTAHGMGEHRVHVLCWPLTAAVVSHPQPGWLA